MTSFPLPGTGRTAVAVAAPGKGVTRWAGSPAAALDADGTFFVAYRIRIGKPPEGRAATVVARSEDGERLATVATLDMDRFGAFSIERPAIVRTESGRWRLPSSPATSTWP